MENLLDKLIQEWACKHRSQVSGKKAQCGHHIIPRANHLTRWDIRNIMPLTFKEHYNIHSKGLDYRIPIQKEYCLKLANSSLVNYLIENKLTEQEFKEQKLEELCKELNISNPKEYTIKEITKDTKKKLNQTEYKKKTQKKAQELWRKRQKELYQKKKTYLKKRKKS